MNKTYTYEELEATFKKGFSVGFMSGKTRSIITKQYYTDVLQEALNDWKKAQVEVEVK